MLSNGFDGAARSGCVGICVDDAFVEESLLAGWGMSHNLDTAATVLRDVGGLTVCRTKGLAHRLKALVHAVHVW